MKAKNSLVRILEGNREHREVYTDIALYVPADFDNGLEPEAKLTKSQLHLWNKYIRKAPWLTKVDINTCHVWCKLTDDFYKDPDGFSITHVRHLRTLAAEIGFTPSARARFKVGKGKDLKKFDGLIGRPDAKNKD